MEKMLWPVHSTGGKMLACYERIRLGRYAQAFRDLSYHILKPQKKEPEDGMEPGAELPMLKICGHFEAESLRHLGERMRDAAELLESVSNEQCRFAAPDVLFRRSLEQKLKKAGFELYDILVIGKDEYYKEYLLSIRSPSGHLLEAEQAAKILSSSFGEKIVPALCCPIFVSREFNEYLFVSAGRFHIVQGQAGVCKDGGSVSGDSYSFTRTGNRFVCMLSDGTGSGEQAQRDSGRLLDLAENYLESGFDGMQMLGFLEGMLLECFLENRVPSLDFLEIDLVNAHMRMAKFGSAVSYLWHGGTLRRIEPENLLLGYEKLSDSKWEEAVLAADDLLILLSDGAADGVEEMLEDTEFSTLLLKRKYINPASLAADILEMAVEADEGRPHDDMTVLVLQVLG